MTYNRIIIEGLDRLGKDTLINSIKHAHGFYQVIHYSKPTMLECYTNKDGNDPIETKREALFAYQEASFHNLFRLLRDAKSSRLIFNRAHLGEAVYSNMYRGYDGNYVFAMEDAYKIADAPETRMILLIENFKISKHFIDDNESLGPVEKREEEQELFIGAFHRSRIKDKKLVCVTSSTGEFKPPAQILAEALG